MNEKNEGFYVAGEQDDSKQLQEVINKLEILLKQIKDDAGYNDGKKDMSRIVKEKIDKTTEALKRAKEQMKAGVDRTTDSLRQAKEKYDNIDPAKQKMIIVALSATLASLVTAVSVAFCFMRKRSDK